MSSLTPHDAPFTVVHGPGAFGGYARLPAVDSVAQGGDVSPGDIFYSPLSSPAPTVSPGSTADIGALGTSFAVPDDGDASIGTVGHQASGVRDDGLALPANDDLPARLPELSDAPPVPPSTGLAATSPIAGDVPWQDPPKPYTTAGTQVWDAVSGVPIGTQQPRRPD
jgi:hypothetical protein